MKLTSSKGWQIIRQWLDDRDNLITNAIKKNFISLKEAESVKWAWYYSGQFKVISDLLSYIENEMKEKREIKNKIT